MKKVLVLGSTGLLGRTLATFIRDRFEFISHGLKESADYNFDVTDFSELKSGIEKIKPHVIINLVALTNVDECELNPQKSYLINVKPLENLYEIIKNTSISLIHISTDQVYDGFGPHLERNISLKNYYAYSKYCSELFVKFGGGIVLRTNFFGKSECGNRQSFSDWLYSNLIKKNRINLFTDVYFSPLSMDTLSSMILIVIERFHPGIYNLGSREGMSKRDFAHKFADTMRINLENAEDTISEVANLKACRPKDMRMNVDLFEKTFDVVLPTLNSEIVALKGKYR